MGLGTIADLTMIGMGSGIRAEPKVGVKPLELGWRVRVMPIFPLPYLAGSEDRTGSPTRRTPRCAAAHRYIHVEYSRQIRVVLRADQTVRVPTRRCIMNDEAECGVLRVGQYAI
jgi:hypothetical protein